jgi:hypothetical protein
MYAEDLEEQVKILGLNDGRIFELFKEGFEYWSLGPTSEPKLNTGHHLYRTPGNSTRIDELKVILEQDLLRAITIGDAGVYQDLQQLGNFVSGEGSLGELYPSTFVYAETGASIPVIWGSQPDLLPEQQEFVLKHPGLFPITTMAKYKEHDFMNVLMMSREYASARLFPEIHTTFLMGSSDGARFGIEFDSQGNMQNISSYSESGGCYGGVAADRWFIAPLDLVSQIGDQATARRI